MSSAFSYSPSSASRGRRGLRRRTDPPDRDSTAAAGGHRSAALVGGEGDAAGHRRRPSITAASRIIKYDDKGDEERTRRRYRHRIRQWEQHQRHRIVGSPSQSDDTGETVVSSSAAAEARSSCAEEIKMEDLDVVGPTGLAGQVDYRKKGRPTLLPSLLANGFNIRRSHMKLEDRPLLDSVYHRFRRFAETTNIHAFLPLGRLKEMGCFYRTLYLAVLCGAITCATYFIKEETINFKKDIVKIHNDYEQATSADLYFPQVVVCNSNFVQATFLQEYNITRHSSLLIRHYFSGSTRELTEEEEKIIADIEAGTLARRVAGALMRFGNSTSTKKLLQLVENKTEAELLALVEEVGMPTPLPLVTGIKPGFRSILRATYNSKERDPNFMAPLFPMYRTDVGWCTLIIPMVEFIDEFQNDNFQTLRETRSPQATKGARLGKDGGLRLLVDAEVYDYSYGSHGAEGFQVAVVPHRDIPLMFLDETQVRPGSLTNIIVKPKLTRTESDVRDRFDPDVRKCYFQDEVVTDKKMGIGGQNRHRYTLSNCYWQATVNHATAVCGCKIWNYGETTDDLNYCTGQGLACFKDVIKGFSSYREFTDNDNDTYKCLNDCEAYTHQLSTNSGSFPNSETFLYDFHDYCAILDKMAISCKDQYKNKWISATSFDCSLMDEDKNLKDIETCTKYVYERQKFNQSVVESVTKKFRDNDQLRQAVWNYTSSNAAVINVFFNDLNVKRMRRKEAYTRPNFAASVGGLLGFAMGVSFVTFFETAYMTIRILLILAFHAVAHCCQEDGHEERRSHRKPPDSPPWRLMGANWRADRQDPETGEFVEGRRK